jgi:predicted O-methyltransferase YrrM
MKRITEVSHPTAECPEPQRWQCFEGMSAEIEVLEFLAQLVITIKPKLIVETGAFCGISACYMGKALKQIGQGRIITCEYDAKLHGIATGNIERSKLGDVVECRLTSSLEMKVEGPIDFLFSDSEPTIRMQEIQHFKPHLSKHAVIAIHDVNTGCHRNLRQQVITADEERFMSSVLLPTPRGLAICQLREGRE